ncbi:hypothetical protein BB560_003711 [Smittium megazygosporum]|uniref:NADH dehydrogenase [ubiquinone] 1 beta subcomplex subunit 8, mitochondrial n=1 Tax=Smittium megazygosporum TaxID=133381 RepID=A0A2T9ZBD9_9FUNG|nr:hypothetical protein BB560_003711 [Smittium megazygosporum]
MNRLVISSGWKNLSKLRTQRQILNAGIRFQSTNSKGNKQYYVDPDPQIGEYPNLPYIMNEERTPYGWWDRQMRRNFGETVHENDEILNMHANSVYEHPPWSTILKQWIAFLGIIGGGIYLMSFTIIERPAIPRHYPYEGLKVETAGYTPLTLQESIKKAMEEIEEK